MGKTNDLRDFKRGMIVSARHARSSVSKTVSSWDFNARQCLEFTKNGATNKKHPVSGSPVGENSWLMKEVEGEWQES